MGKLIHNSGKPKYRIPIDEPRKPSKTYIQTMASTYSAQMNHPRIQLYAFDFDWIDRISPTWELVRADSVFSKVDVRSSKGEEDLLSVSESDGVRLRSSAAVTMFQAESYAGHKLCWPGDLVINSLWAWSRGLGFSEHHGIVSTAYSVFRPDTTRYNVKYLNYLLRTREYVRQYLIASKGVWISRLQLGDWAFLRLPILTPPLEAQSRIAAFLDQKTALIDQAIAQKQGLIQLLEERRQILIHRAVTRGLDPNVELKDSGVEWIGEVPKHWEVKKLKHVLRERVDRTEHGEEPLLMVSQKHGLVVRADHHDKAEVAQSNIDNKRVFEGDLVFNKLKAHLGVFFRSFIQFTGIVSPDYAVYYLKAHMEDAKYLELLFKTKHYIAEFVKRTTGIVEGLMRLYTSDLYELSLGIPPIKEQVAILDYVSTIDRETNQMTRLIEKQVSRLREYRATLINAAVTGQIEGLR